MNAPLTTLTSEQKPVRQSVRNKPPGKPDWLLIMVGALFLLTLLIIWLIDVF